MNSDQKRYFDSVTTAIYARRNEDTNETNGNKLVLQGGAGVGNTFTLHLLRDMEISWEFQTEIMETTETAAALYKGGRTLDSLLRLGGDDKDEDEKLREPLATGADLNEMSCFESISADSAWRIYDG